MLKAVEAWACLQTTAKAFCDVSVYNVGFPAKLYRVVQKKIIAQSLMHHYSATVCSSIMRFSFTKMVKIDRYLPVDAKSASAG